MMNTIPAVAFAAGLFLPACLPAAARATDYNGRWAVELVTETGLCDTSSRYAVAISGGQVRLVSGGDGARISGRIGADGRVGLDVAKGSASGSGTGRLRAGSGSGTWTVSSLCSGRWSARRADG